MKGSKDLPNNRINVASYNSPALLSLHICSLCPRRGPEPPSHCIFGIVETAVFQSSLQLVKPLQVFSGNLPIILCLLDTRHLLQPITSQRRNNTCPKAPFGRALVTTTRLKPRFSTISGLGILLFSKLLLTRTKSSICQGTSESVLCCMSEGGTIAAHFNIFSIIMKYRGCLQYE